jgi:hypothetical protein
MGEVRVDGVTINISEHGMYLFAATNLSLETEIEITFRSPDKRKLIRTVGVVRRKAVYLYGIEFTNDGKSKSSVRDQSTEARRSDASLFCTQCPY